MTPDEIAAWKKNMAEMLNSEPTDTCVRCHKPHAKLPAPAVCLDCYRELERQAEEEIAPKYGVVMILHGTREGELCYYADDDHGQYAVIYFEMPIDKADDYRIPLVYLRQATDEEAAQFLAKFKEEK